MVSQKRGFQKRDANTVEGQDRRTTQICTTQMRGLTYQVVIRQVGDRIRLNAEILKRFGVGVNDMVDEFTLDLVSAADGPPEELVENVGERFHD